MHHQAEGCSRAMLLVSQAHIIILCITIVVCDSSSVLQDPEIATLSRGTHPGISCDVTEPGASHMAPHNIGFGRIALQPIGFFERSHCQAKTLANGTNSAALCKDALPLHSLGPACLELGAGFTQAAGFCLHETHMPSSATKCKSAGATHLA